LVTLKISTKVHLGKRSELLDTFRLIAEKTRHEKGCHDCRISQDIMIEELWMTQEDLDRQLSSAEYRDVLLVVEMSNEKPEIRFSVFPHSTDVETIEKARSRVV